MCHTHCLSTDLGIDEDTVHQGHVGSHLGLLQFVEVVTERVTLGPDEGDCWVKLRHQERVDLEKGNLSCDVKSFF